jgi:hypothetical protein
MREQAHGLDLALVLAFTTIWSAKGIPCAEASVTPVIPRGSCLGRGFDRGSARRRRRG